VTAKCYTAAVASKYRRLGVARDPQIEQALARTRPLLGREDTRSAAAQVRALTLRGAESILASAGPAGDLRRRLAGAHEIKPASVEPHSVNPLGGEVDPADPRPASDALRWVRGG